MIEKNTKLQVVYLLPNIMILNKEIHQEIYGILDSGFASKCMITKGRSMFDMLFMYLLQVNAWY